MPTAFLSARDGEPGEVSTTLELQPEGTEGKGGMTQGEREYAVCIAGINDCFGVIRQ